MIMNSMFGSSRSGSSLGWNVALDTFVSSEMSCGDGGNFATFTLSTPIPWSDVSEYCLAIYNIGIHWTVNNSGSDFISAYDQNSNELPGCVFVNSSAPYGCMTSIRYHRCDSTYGLTESIGGSFVNSDCEFFRVGRYSTAAVTDTSSTVIKLGNIYSYASGSVVVSIPVSTRITVMWR